MTQSVRDIFLVSVISFVFFLLVPPFSSAAILYIDPGEAEVYRGDTVTLSIRLDTDEGECINAVDAIIEYDDAIRAVDVSRGESILNIWVEEPVIDESSNTITLAGGIPGGYCGRIAGDPKLTNIIADLVFRSPGLSIGREATPEAGIRFGSESQVLLHDGFGTKALLRTVGASLTLLDTAGSSVEDDWRARINEDTIPPADFTITLSQEENAFNGKYFIVFNTLDKQSGIDHYEIIEEPFKDFDLFTWGAATAPWITAESPYVLKDQSLNSTIRVKAIDKAGNETISVLVPNEALRGVSIERIVMTSLLVLVGILVALSIGYALWRRKQSLIEDYEEDESE